MIKQIQREGRRGDLLAFEVSGTVHRDDYDVLVPAVEQALHEHDDINLVLDLTDLKWEAVSSWWADLRFGQQYHDRIDRLAIVGDGRLERALAKLASPFYANQSRYFETREEAFGWAATTPAPH